MRYFYDTEFVERGPEHPVELVSLGMVREDGREFYGISGEIPLASLWDNEWLRANVVPHLPLSVDEWTDGPDPRQHPLHWDNSHPDAVRVMSRRQLREEVRNFLFDSWTTAGTRPELWAWYGAYDHVCLAQLWGTMAQLPDGVPMWTNDLRQEVLRRGDLRVPVQKSTTEHHALADARWNVEVWQWLQRLDGVLEHIDEELSNRG